MFRQTLTRIAFAYVVLNALNYGVWILPYGRLLRFIQMRIAAPIVVFFGENLLGMESVVVPSLSTRSSDTSYDWAFMALTLSASATIAGLWSALVPRLDKDAALTGRLRVLLRYGLAGNMMAYGAAKLIPMQFSEVSSHTLAQSYGDSSPMTLLWTFMGFSPSYVFVVGLLELSSVALLFRRTVLLGALCCFGILFNIVLLNLLYDVPVKLFALHFLAASLFLLWPYRIGLYRLVWSHAAIEPEMTVETANHSEAGRPRALGKAIVIAWLIGATVVWPIAYRKTAAAIGIAEGVFDRVLLNDDQLGSDSPVRITIVAKDRSLRLWGIQGAMREYELAQDRSGDLTATPRGESGSPLNLSPIDRGYRIVNLAGDSAPLVFKRRTPVLTSRGFHWVSEAPFF